MTDQPPVLTEKRVRTFRITINRPERNNAMNDHVTGGIAEALRTAQADGDVRAVVLTGAGEKTFCAGGDLSPQPDGSPFKTEPSRPQLKLTDMFEAFEACTLPIIARVNGHALGGGFGLVCACDLAVGVKGARLGTPEVGVGLFPMTILPYMLRVLPRRKVLELCMRGTPWSAERACEEGLLNAVAEPGGLDDLLDEFLADIVKRSPTAIRLGKIAYHAVQDMPIREAQQYTQLMLPIMAGTEDGKEGFGAFQQKRDPDWPNR
jgi:enoyl-CoA hydratase/carnithine racemase